MNDRLSAKLKMYMQVREVCEKNKTTWQVNPAFNRAVESVKTAVTGINETNTRLQGTDAGITEDKSGQKAQMAKVAVKISGALQVYAYEKELTSLSSDAELSKDDIMKAKDVDADDLALHIHRLGTKHIADLADYGVVQEDLDQLQLIVEKFTSKIGSPRLNQSERKTLREKQEAHFEQADKAIQNVLDKLIYQFETKDSAFFDTYQRARSVIRTSTGKTIADAEKAGSVLA